MEYPRRAVPSMSGLIAFEATARHLSFSRAAEDLALTQGAVSKRVRQLEQVLGVPLLARNTHYVCLTEMGETYLDHVRKMLAHLQVSAEDLQSRGQGKSQINVSVSAVFATRWLVPRLGGFYRAHPNCVVNLCGLLAADVPGDDDIDCAISDVVSDLGEDDGLTFAQSDEIVVASPHYAAKMGLRSLDDLSRAALLRTNSDPHVWSEWFATTGRNEPVDAGARFDDLSVLIETVLCGQGVALIPRLLVQSDIRHDRLTHLLPDRVLKRRRYFLTLRQGRAGCEPVSAFQSWLMKAGDRRTRDRLFQN